MLQRLWLSPFHSAAKRASFIRLYSTQNPLDGGFVDQLIDQETPSELRNHQGPLHPSPNTSPDLRHPPAPPKDGYPGSQPPTPQNQNPMRAEGLRNNGDSILPSTSRFASKTLSLHCKSSRNNTITTLAGEKGVVYAWYSGGSCGFKKGNRASYEAGYQCAVRMFEAIKKLAAEENGKVDVRLVFQGFGQGREALNRALMTAEGEAVRPLVSWVIDKTPIKIGGTRAKKARRL